MPRSPALARDAALRRLRRLNRWLIAGSVVVTAFLTDVAAQAFPGHTITRTSSTSQGSRARPTVARERNRPTRHHALKPPTQAPKASSQVVGSDATSAPAAGSTQTAAPAAGSSQTADPAPSSTQSVAPPAPVQPAPAPAPVVSGGS